MSAHDAAMPSVDASAQGADTLLDGPIGDVVYLVRCALDGVSPDVNRVGAMDLDAVYRTSQRHLLVAACATSLESAGVRDARFVQARAKAVRKIALMDAERAEVFRQMDAAGIWHVPLKGCVLQGLWPSYGMRQMADNDILFDASRADDVRSIMEDRGFSTEHFGTGNHDVYHKEPVCNFELHRSLFGPTHNQAFYEYYRDSSRLLEPDGDGTCGMHFSDENFYVYLVAHENKHFAASGTGLRSLADTFVWLRAKSNTMNWVYVAEQLDKLGLADFEAQNRRLATALFSGGDLTDDAFRMLSYMADSGTYGTMAHNVGNQIARYGRAGYLMCRAFPPLRTMAMLYPVLDKAPALLPACWAWRLVSALATKPKKVAYQLRAPFRKK